MQAGRLVSGALLAVGVMLVGCGGPLEGDPGTDDLMSREDPVPDCSLSSAGTIYYSTAARTAIVGYRGCGCGAWTSWGQTTAYTTSTTLCVAGPNPD
ncbi:hypothetical protein LZ198_07220 [Myxococcus sp. K15C18031901]|uniref:hypothetical protein n=1 Tax=Myxococcus dinghuensis TaxID=2906761 RepID=UPI0020A7CF02|nr:hypothetical protein [Myxococcus dinghuensis]MCP3098665.1 hypothetical protein [Myxococcus dinghuensis]